MSSLETFVQGGREERKPALDDVRLNDGSPVSFALLDQDMHTMDKRMLEDAKSTMRQLFESDEAFVSSLNGLSAEEVSEKVRTKLAEIEKQSSTLH